MVGVVGSSPIAPTNSNSFWFNPTKGNPCGAAGTKRLKSAALQKTTALCSLQVTQPEEKCRAQFSGCTGRRGLAGD